MAVSKSDSRNPDTNADKASAGSTPATPELDKEVYGFRTIEEAEPAEGPGAVDPVRVEPVSSVPNSTFASRAGNGGVESKAVQSAENK